MLPASGAMIAPIPFGLGYGAWKLGKYIYEKFNKPPTPIDRRKETEIEELTAEPIYFVVAILAKFAKADGIVTKNEVATIEEIFRDIELTGETRTSAVSIFRKHKRGALSYEESLTIFARLTEDSIDFRTGLCILLLRLAHADGTPPQCATEGVRQACNACDVDYAEVYQIFRQQERTLHTNGSEPKCMPEIRINMTSESRIFPIGDHDVRLNIGRADECDIVLADPAISRCHASLYAKDGKWRVQLRKSFRS
jgi:uncharacterized tellurite resistance protein B-like protein